ncbi:MAG: DOMON-like domain-containing protein, partial [Betaproteobacteria bacterium]|nr:DOMON-like domain-containing protein [Betaproteobacteria bacterium]
RAHPDFPCAAVASLQVEVTPLADGLRLDYCLRGDLVALRLPSPAAPVEPDRLWAHTCFEVFLARGDGAAYREYNFSPSGQWAAYSFTGYRQPDGAVPALPCPILAWRQDAGELALEVTLPAAALPPGDGALCLALTTVVELEDGVLSYWALRHPAGKPDFHHRDGFAPPPCPDLLEPR